MNLPTVFVSYCHKNKADQEELSSHLKVLENIDLIDQWSDENIQSGELWHDRIVNAIEQAQLAILIITKEFLSSEYIKKEEIPRLLRLQSAGALKILPVIAEHCTWEKVTWIKKREVRPKNKIPVWSNDSDTPKVLKEIADEVADILERVSERVSPEATQKILTRPSEGSLQLANPSAKVTWAARERSAVASPKFQLIVLALTAVFLTLFAFCNFTTLWSEGPTLFFKTQVPERPTEASFAVNIMSHKTLSPNEYEEVEFKVKNVGTDTYTPIFWLKEGKSIPSWHFKEGSRVDVKRLESGMQDTAKNEIRPHLDISQVGSFLGKPVGLSLTGTVQDQPFSSPQELPLYFARLPWIQKLKYYSGLMWVLSFIYFLILRGWRVQAYRVLD